MTPRCCSNYARGLTVLTPIANATLHRVQKAVGLPLTVTSSNTDDSGGDGTAPRPHEEDSHRRCAKRSTYATPRPETAARAFVSR